MFKNRKIEVRMVKDEVGSYDPKPTTTILGHIYEAEDVLTRIGKQVVLGVCIVIVVSAASKTVSDIAIEHFRKN